MEFWGVIAAWGSAVAAIITIVVSLYISWSNSSPIIVAYLYNDIVEKSLLTIFIYRVLILLSLYRSNLKKP